MKYKEEIMPNANMRIFTYIIVDTLTYFTIVTECADYWCMSNLWTITPYDDT